MVAFIVSSLLSQTLKDKFSLPRKEEQPNWEKKRSPLILTIDIVEFTEISSILERFLQDMTI